MLRRKIDDLLTLLALSIFIDKKVLSQEIDTFMRGAKSLQIGLNIEPRLTEASMLSWFDRHREALREQAESADLSTWVIPLLERLKPLNHKKQILDVMSEISMSDNEFHQSEKDLIALTAHHWAMAYPQHEPQTES